MKVASNTAKILRNVPLPDEVSVIHNNATILDIGSYSTRVGLAGDNAPRMDERSVVIKGTEPASPEPTNYSGNNARQGTKSAGLCFDKAYSAFEERDRLIHVMKNGMVTDWDALEQLLHRVDDMMLLSSAEMHHPLLVTEKALVPHFHRQKMAEILFEQFHLQATFFALSPVLALYASGICTGVSVEMGHEQCHIAPVFQGFAHFHATHSLPIGGHLLTSLLQRETSARLPSTVLPHFEDDTWTYLKEVCGYTLEHRSSFSTAMHNRTAQKYQFSHRLPDGTVMTLGAERFMPSEAYFQPAALLKSELDNELLSGRQSEVESEVLLRSFGGTVRGVHDLLVDAVKKCDHDLAPMFLDNILLSGGSSLFPGLPERLESEVQGLLPTAADRVRVIAEVERRGAAFVGGSILASLPSFQPLWTTRKDYEEIGSIAVVRGGFNA